MTQARDLADLAGAADAGTITGRNLIINGAMQVAQRGTVTGVTAAYGGPDRFKMSSGGSGEFTISQDTDVPSGQGFTSSFKIDVTTADSSLAASDNAFWYQLIEGQNTQHIKKGTANAESLTLQFWIKSSTTGTYIVELYDNDNTRHIAASYTVDTADTWEHKTVTFAGDTTGTIANDNTAGLHVGWWLAAGTTFNPVSGTLQTSWGAGDNAARAVGQVNAIDDAANNIYFTGVQLEVGATATDFEHESYATTLAKCQRYLPAWTADNLNSRLPGAGIAGLNNTIYLTLIHSVETRVKPTGVVVSAASHWAGGVDGIVANNTMGSISYGLSSTYATRLTCTVASGTPYTQGHPAYIEGINTSGLIYLTGCEL